MTNRWQGGQTRVERLRLRGGGPDPTLARLRLTNMLGGAQLHPAGLGPSAILCVRRLRGPAPGSLSSRVACAVTPPAWEQAVSAALGELARRAARPALDFVSADAEAVLFADQAEMLACYVGDCCAGLAGACWWWKSLFPGVDAPPARALLEAPECVPAVFEHLALRGRAVAFARTLRDAEARGLLRCVTRSFGLPLLQTALDAAFDAPRAAPETNNTQHARGESVFVRGVDARDVSERAPWHAHVPESARLEPARQALLGVCLLLRRAPALARAQSFARAARLWLLDALAHGRVETHLTQNSEPIAERLPADQTTRTRTTSAGPQGGPRDDRHLAAPAHDNPPAVTQEGELQGPSQAARESKALPPNKTHSPPDAAAADGAGGLFSLDAREPPRAHEGVGDSESAAEVGALSGSRAPARQADEPTPARAVADASVLHTVFVETELGGVFYLINLALFLELYGDFTRPAAPGIALDPWDFLALAGARLTGSRRPADPLWPLLAHLAGREAGEPPGRLYSPADVWRVPASWLGPFPEHAELEWTAGAGRLRVRHPEGFLLLDLPLRRRDPDALLARELKSYRGQLSFGLRRAPARPREAQGANRRERWLARLVPYARARLRRALGLARSRDPGRFLCERRARVNASATRVDVFFSLAELPVGVRLSGVDRDPGWVPAAGRQIAFHYE